MNLSDIKKIWNAELILGVLLLIVFLAFDFWVYNAYVRGGAGGVGAPEVATLLKKNALEKAANKIKSQNQFLKNPSFGVVKNPF